METDTKENKGSDPDDLDVVTKPSDEIDESRDKKTHTTNPETLMHIIKGNFGPGLQAMPLAFKHAGIILGSVGTLVIGAVCTYSMLLLVQSCRTLCGRTKQSAMDYADVVETAFKCGPQKVQKLSKIFRNIVDVFLCITQLGVCCVFVVYVSSNIKAVFDFWYPDNIYDLRMYILFHVPFFIAMGLLNNLKILAPLSAISNLFMCICLCFIFYNLLSDIPDIKEREYVAGWHTIPMWFATAIYSFEGIGLVLPIENKMLYPSALSGWHGVLSIGMGIVTCFNVVMGLFGYLKYGDAVEGSITLNLPPGEWISLTVEILMAVACYFTFALQFYVPIEIIWPKISPKFADSKYAESLFRIILVVLISALGASIPNLGLFISLVGSVASTALGLIFPPIIHSLTFPEHHRLVHIKNLSISTFGVIGSVFGTYISITNIIDFLNTG